MVLKAGEARSGALSIHQWCKYVHVTLELFIWRILYCGGIPVLWRCLAFAQANYNKLWLQFVGLFFFLKSEICKAGLEIKTLLCDLILCGPRCSSQGYSWAVVTMVGLRWMADSHFSSIAVRELICMNIYWGITEVICASQHSQDKVRWCFLFWRRWWFYCYLC